MVPLLVTLEVGFFLWVLSVLGTVFLGSRFMRKDATFSTGGFIQSWLTRTDTVPAGAGIIKQVFFTSGLSPSSLRIGILQ